MIEIIDVSKKFRLWEDRSRDLKETAINFLRGKKRSYRDLWALQGIDLEIKEGDTVAFIGKNGSGKSTLLKVLAGIYTPDEGKVVTRGRISTLLELGVGFHPDLTGEENIYLNGAMLGFDRKEMEQRFGEIVSFSEIGDFVYSPIRTYSSGMLMRLGFSIATCVDPDILLVDEILAVGDEAFQEKCLNRMEEFKKNQKTIVLVSHSMEMVQRFCKRAVLLQGGRVVKDGFPEETIESYHVLLSVEREGAAEVVPRAEKRKRTKSAAIGEGERDRDQKIETAASHAEDLPVEVVEPMVSPEGLAEEENRMEVFEAAKDDSFDPDRMEVIEVQDPTFLAEGLFRESFGQSPPRDSKNYVGVYHDSKEPSVFHVIGFIHVGETDANGLKQVGFPCGICVDRRWQGRGIEKIMLSSIEARLEDKTGFFVYTADKERVAEWGYEALPHPYLMVKWVKPLSSEEKARLVGASMAIGPF